MKGASKGEGLGNQFLGNIREVDAIAHVLRCFEDGDVTHVSGSVDPVRDAEVVETELMLADLESLEKRLPNLEKRGQGRRQGSRPPRRRWSRRRSTRCARASRRARPRSPTTSGWFSLRLQLITAKPMMYVLNVEEAAAARAMRISAKAERGRRASACPAS